MNPIKPLILLIKIHNILIKNSLNVKNFELFKKKFNQILIKMDEDSPLLKNQASSAKQAAKKSLFLFQLSL